MPNKGTSKHLNSVQYFTLFVQSKSQMYLRDLTRDCACIAVRHNRVAERSWLHCSCENGVPWIHLPGYHHFSHENCHNDTPGPPCPSPASWPVKEGSDLPKSTSIFKCYICIYNILYIYIYIYTNTHVCFPKRIEGDSWLYILLEYCHSGFPRYMMIYVYNISNVIDLSWCLSHRLISTASLARFEAKSSGSSNLTTNGRVSSPVVYRSTGPPTYLPTYRSI